MNWAFSLVTQFGNTMNDKDDDGKVIQWIVGNDWSERDASVCVAVFSYRKEASLQ